MPRLLIITADVLHPTTSQDSGQLGGEKLISAGRPYYLPLGLDILILAHIPQFFQDESFIFPQHISTHMPCVYINSKLFPSQVIAIAYDIIKGGKVEYKIIYKLNLTAHAIEIHCLRLTNIKWRQRQVCD